MIKQSTYKRAAHLVWGIILILSSTIANAAELPVLSKLLAKHDIPQSAVSIDIREITNQTPILTLNRNTPRNPASAIKLLTSLAALELLGPAYKWETTYLSNGVVDDAGVLNGDLIMKGGGDPFLTLDRFWRHVHSIRQQGISHITGDFVIDNSIFTLKNHDPHAFDGQATRLYNVGPSASLVNFSATNFAIQPQNGRISVTADPPLANLIIENNLKPSNRKCRSKQSGWSFEKQTIGDNIVVRFNGKYATRCGNYSLGRSVASNDQYTFSLFKYLWTMSGGTIAGSYRTEATQESASPIITHPSEPLSDVITGINKFSNNVMAKQLLLTMGFHLYDYPGTVETGILAVRSWLNATGLSMPNLVLENGSGLSRKTRITAQAISDLLAHGWNSTYQPEFLSSLSLSAMDGTMRKRLTETSMMGRARIKTGLVNGVRSMAGYLHSAKGHHYSVVMMIDSKNVNYWNGNQIQDAILAWLYDR